MSYQPGQISEDGRWRWTGTEWVANQPSQPPPPQGGPPPTGPRTPGKRKRWPWVLGIPLALIVLITVCSIAVSNSNSKPTPTSTPAQANATSKPTQAAVAAAPAQDGSCSPQPCQNDSYGWIVSVSNLHYDAPGGYGGQHAAEAGNVFVTMDMTFTNKLKNEQHANPSEFVLKDASGVKHTTSYTEACPPWQPVNLTTGGTFGPRCTAFEASAGKPSGLVLTWTPHFGADYDIKLS